jgi:GTP-binding protein HflX
MKKSAIVVGLKLPNLHDFDQAFEELDNLAIACDYYVVKRIQQNLSAQTADYSIGSGKVLEIKEAIEETQAKAVIFDHELSPVHIRNLEQALAVPIIDRTMLILQIFETRAQTKEAKLQVGLAKAQYMLPRLIDNTVRLGRIKAGKGSKGAGEQQLELDKRRYRNQISRARRELKLIVEARRTQRHKRQQDQLFSVALVGYTNAGKSALLNQFMSLSHRGKDKKVFEKDMLFATLQTSTRRVQLHPMIQFLLIDTVGFVRRLPHHLIEAFKSTLEELKEADLIIHVVDISDPYYAQHIVVVEEVLAKIGVSDVPILYALNKIDIIRKPQGALPANHIKISALKGLGMSDLIQRLTEYLIEEYHPVRLHIPYEHSHLIDQLRKDGIVLNTNYLELYIDVTVAFLSHQMEPYEAFIQTEHLN